jgi:flagellar hook-length control protein FliK
MEALGANLPVLRQMIKEQGSLFAVPGVRVETDVTVVTRAE